MKHETTVKLNGISLTVYEPCETRDHSFWTARSGFLHEASNSHHIYNFAGDTAVAETMIKICGHLKMPWAVTCGQMPNTVSVSIPAAPEGRGV